jgi:hypothetical protein
LEDSSRESPDGHLPILGASDVSLDRPDLRKGTIALAVQFPLNQHISSLGELPILQTKRALQTRRSVFPETPDPGGEGSVTGLSTGVDE